MYHSKLSTNYNIPQEGPPPQGLAVLCSASLLQADYRSHGHPITVNSTINESDYLAWLTVSIKLKFKYFNLF